MEGLFQPTHLVFIFIVLLIFFGGKKLPELGRGLGAGIKEFKEALRAGTNEPPSETKPPEEKKS